MRWAATCSSAWESLSEEGTLSGGRAPGACLRSGQGRWRAAATGGQPGCAAEPLLPHRRACALGLSFGGFFLTANAGSWSRISAADQAAILAVSGEAYGRRPAKVFNREGAASARYDWEANGFSGYVRLTANHRSDMVARFSDVPASVFPRVSPSASIVNLQAGLDWSNQSLTLNVSNLLDEDYYSGVDSFSHSGAVTTPGGQFVNLAWTMTADF